MTNFKIHNNLFIYDARNGRVNQQIVDTEDKKEFLESLKSQFKIDLNEREYSKYLEYLVFAQNLLPIENSIFWYKDVLNDEDWRTQYKNCLHYKPQENLKICTLKEIPLPEKIHSKYYWGDAPEKRFESKKKTSEIISYYLRSCETYKGVRYEDTPLNIYLWGNGQEDFHCWRQYNKYLELILILSGSEFFTLGESKHWIESQFSGEPCVDEKSLLEQGIKAGTSI